jgi:hypothetical protein
LGIGPFSAGCARTSHFDLRQTFELARSSTLAPMAQYDWIHILGIATLAATVGLICVILFSL